jgi:hypothetical protein
LFAGAQPGSLQIVAELPEPSPSLFPEQDIGPRALQALTGTFQAITQHDSAAIESLFPDFGRRTRILASALPLLPEEEADYEIALGTRTGSVRLRADLRPCVARMVREPVDRIQEESIRTLTGKLYLIEVATGQRHLGVIVSNRHIPCYYPPQYEDMVRDLIPGSLVEVEGFASFNEQGEIRQIEEILDVYPIQILPLYWTRVIHESRRFCLRERIEIAVDLRDNLWIHEYEPLGITALGHSRAESLNAFRLDFAACWDSIAQEDEKNLTADARQLKAKLLQLVERVEDVY